MKALKCQTLSTLLYVCIEHEHGEASSNNLKFGVGLYIQQKNTSSTQKLSLAIVYLLQTFYLVTLLYSASAVQRSLYAIA